MIEYRELMDALNDIIIIGTVIKAISKALKKLQDIFFKHGKHEKK